MDIVVASFKMNHLCRKEEERDRSYLIRMFRRRGLNVQCLSCIVTTTCMSAAPATIVPVRAGDQLHAQQLLAPLTEVVLHRFTEKRHHDKSKPPPSSSPSSSTTNNTCLVITEDHLDLTVDIDSDIESSISDQTHDVKFYNQGYEPDFKKYFAHDYSYIHSYGDYWEKGE